LHQRALAALIESGRYDRQIRRMRAEYAARRSLLVETVSAHAPTARLSGLAAGFHAVLHLPPSVAEHEVVAGALSRSVGLHGMSSWRADGAVTPPQLVIGFGAVSQEAIARGIGLVADLLRG
jgi:GntR family transcriptional regulator/MocR family aminotransferase